MIKITQVKRDIGQVILTVQYSTDGTTKTVEVDAEQVVDRLKQLRDLLGRKPSLEEAKNVIITLIDGIRRQREPLVDVVSWENFINVNLESGA